MAGFVIQTHILDTKLIILVNIPIRCNCPVWHPHAKAIIVESSGVSTGNGLRALMQPDVVVG